MNRLHTTIAGLTLHNPLMTASGCFGYGTDYSDYFDPNLLGAVVLKGLTPEPRSGNTGIRIAETPSGMLNCVGLENPGLDAFLHDILPDITQQLHVPIIANINGKTVEEYTMLAAVLDKNDGIAALEVNISCPNVKDGGMSFGTDCMRTAEVVGSVRNVCKKPLIVKLSPNVTDIRTIARTAETEGADALSLINTVAGMSIDIVSQKPLLGNISGGLSGPAIKPIALKMIYDVSQTVSIPIIGMGGISSGQDALEFILAGASALSIGCAFFKNPLVAGEILQEMQSYCALHNVHIEELIGRSHPDNGDSYRKRRNIYAKQYCSK